MVRAGVPLPDAELLRPGRAGAAQSRGSRQPLLAPEPLLLPLIILATFATVIVSISRRGLFGWRRSLFGWMLQNSSSTASYFALPPNRVVELGTQVAI